MFVDTSFCVDLFREQVRGGAGPATMKLAALGDSALFASVFVMCELQAGARMSSRPRRELRRVEVFSAHLNVVYPDDTFPVAYGEAEAALRGEGCPIPPMDLLIGVTAKSHGQPLLTRDVKHFRSIPGLVVESY